MVTIQDNIKTKQLEIIVEQKILNNLRNDLANLQLDLQTERLSAVEI